MGDATIRSDALLRLAARRLTGRPRRLCLAEVTLQLCDGRARPAERRFCWGRGTITKGLRELQQGIPCSPMCRPCGRKCRTTRKPWKSRRPKARSGKYKLPVAL